MTSKLPAAWRTERAWAARRGHCGCIANTPPRRGNERLVGLVLKLGIDDTKLSIASTS
ncbi:MAG TPA: hypothetical protein VLX61_02140 [Anaerolineales bacterium]|nr:hypothetical protein [Anaerolineales bacterium]